MSNSVHGATCGHQAAQQTAQQSSICGYIKSIFLPPDVWCLMWCCSWKWQQHSEKIQYCRTLVLKLPAGMFKKVHLLKTHSERVWSSTAVITDRGARRWLSFLLSRSLHRSTQCVKRQERLNGLAANFWPFKIKLTLWSRCIQLVPAPVSPGAGLQRAQISKQVLTTRAWNDLTSRLRPRLTASDLQAFQRVRMNECGRNPDRPCRSSLFKYEEKIFLVYFLPPLVSHAALCFPLWWSCTWKQQCLMGNSWKTFSILHLEKRTQNKQNVFTSSSVLIVVLRGRDARCRWPTTRLRAHAHICFCGSCRPSK